MDVLDASFSGAHISAVEAQVAHAGQSQLPQVALLHPTAHQGHGDVTLHPQCCLPNQSMTWECHPCSGLACTERCKLWQRLDNIAYMHASAGNLMQSCWKSAASHSMLSKLQPILRCSCSSTTHQVGITLQLCSAHRSCQNKAVQPDYCGKSNLPC